MSYSKISNLAGTSDGGVSLPDVQEVVVYDGTTESSRRIADLEHVVRSLVARIRKVGGYSTPEEQDVLWEAERVLGGER